MTDAQKDAAVARFHGIPDEGRPDDPTCRVFVGSIFASGVGITLTISSHVVFAELDWVPGNMSQAEDRAHRMGQHDSVLVQHLVIDGSVDSKVARTLVEKQALADAALDDDINEIREQPVSLVEEPSTAGVTRRMVWQSASALSFDQIAETRADLLATAARFEAGTITTFNRIDAHVARALSAKSALTPQEAVLARYVVGRYSETENLVTT